MQLTYLSSLMRANEGISKITAMCYSPNDRRLAVCGADRIVTLFDGDGERRDKFSTKPAEKVGPGSATRPRCCSFLSGPLVGAPCELA